MLLCVPTTDDGGLSARLSPHFGRAPWFTLVDSRTGRVETLPNATARHEHGACRPLDALRDRSPDALVCRGIGRRAFDRCRELGIGVFLADAFDVTEALHAYDEGRVKAVTPDSACRGDHYDVAHGDGSRRS
jgi:predicted Fe-Mo cluster-binding NifX family protein